MGRDYLHPGEVTSQTDGQTHWIDAPQLASLYELKYMECFVIYDNISSAQHGRQVRLGDRHFYPRDDGDYSIVK